MKITIEIDDEVYERLTLAVQDLTGPPIREESQIVTPLAFPRGARDWVATILENNIANVLRHNPTASLKAILDEVAQLEQQAKTLMRPTVSLVPPPAMDDQGVTAPAPMS